MRVKSLMWFRKRAKAAGQFKHLVKGAHKGAMKGQKQKRKQVKRSKWTVCWAVCNNRQSDPTLTKICFNLCM